MDAIGRGERLQERGQFLLDVLGSFWQDGRGDSVLRIERESEKRTTEEKLQTYWC